MILLAALCLSGCVRYDTGLTFNNPHQGTIVQQIKVADALTVLNRDLTDRWLQRLERQVRQAQGKVERLPNQTVIVTIPFFQARDLEEKFNGLWATVREATQVIADPSMAQSSALPDIKADLQLRQSNFLLVQRSHLIYDLDLRSLQAELTTPNLPINPNDLLHLEFSLTTPWGARSLSAPDNLQPHGDEPGKQLIWTIQPGQPNRIEVIFWLPDPIAIGTVVIVLLVVAGLILRYRILPAPRPILPVE